MTRAAERIETARLVLRRPSIDSGAGVRVEGEVLFPESGHSYLGLIYNYGEAKGRIDFGSIYIKGNDSYIRVNPHRDRKRWPCALRRIPHRTG